MGVDIYLTGDFPGATVTKTTVADTIQELLNEGFTTNTDGPDELVQSYGIHGFTEDSDSRQYLESGRSNHLDEILDDVEDDQLLKIPVYYDNTSFTLKFAFGPPIGNTDITVSIHGPDEWWFDGESEGEAVVTERCNNVVKLLTTLAATVDPEVGYITLFNDHSLGEELVATETPSDEQNRAGWNLNLEALPWVVLLGDTWIDACGGREHVLATPGVAVRELDTGHILGRLASNPASVVGGTNGEAYEHLFGE